MKTAISIFSIYFLALSLVPCSDGGGGIIEIVNHLFGIEHQHHSDHTDHSKGCGDDTCSPFCICTCCSTSIDITQNTILDFNKSSFNLRRKLMYISNLIVSPFISPVWHPPAH